MKALVIGATGATGRDLVAQLLADAEVTEVDIFVRRQTDLSHPKLHVHVVDFEHIDQWKHRLTGDVLFSAMGTTLKQAGGQKAQWRVDYDYQYDVAQAAADNGVRCLELVSSVGANPKALVFYSRMKGQLEEAIRKLPFASIHIMRPPSLVRKHTDRYGEVLSIKVLHLVNRLGLLKSLKPMPTEVVASAMIRTAKQATSGVHIYDAQALWSLQS